MRYDMVYANKSSCLLQFHDKFVTKLGWIDEQVVSLALFLFPDNRLRGMNMCGSCWNRGKGKKGPILW